MWGDSLRKGLAKRDPALPPLEVYAGGAVAVGEGLESYRDMSRPGIALYVGGMGAKEKNFYNQIFRKYGYEEEAETIQDLYSPAGNPKRKPRFPRATSTPLHSWVPRVLCGTGCRSTKKRA